MRFVRSRPLTRARIKLFPTGIGRFSSAIRADLRLKTRLIADNPQYVINCSAYTDVIGAETNGDKANEVNGNGVGYLAEVCNMIGATLIHFSTDYIFDGTKGDYYVEEDKANPLNKYGMSKYEGEKEIIRFHDKYFIIRTSWDYSHYEGNFVHSILNKMIKDKEVKVVSDQYGSPTSATDLALLALRICNIQSKKYGTYHYSSDSHINWCTFADVINCRWRSVFVLIGLFELIRFVLLFGQSLLELGDARPHGTRQAGHLPELRLADLVRHVDLLGAAREAAARVVEHDPELRRHGSLRSGVERRWGRRLDFGAVG